MRKSNCSILKVVAYFSLISITLFACQKEVLQDPIPSVAPPNIIDFTTKVNSSVSGFVTNENNLPVQGATVKVGTTTITTNRYGYFEVRNVRVVQTAATVTVTNTGYFNGIKTYIAEEGKAAFFRIKLLPKTSAGTFVATAGGTVTTTNNVKITLPANAVVNATTLAAYTGVVTVLAKWIDPTSAELNNIMPGDLRGIDASNGLKLLTTFGMAAVELTGAAGELLQIATGKKATLTMPIPASLQATAPSTIPLWYFDEANGLWKEEGSATKTGTDYIGDVSHFSFWNYDVPANFVQFNCTLKNAAGNPLSGMQVKISVVSNPSSAGYGYTDSAGYVGGAVPNNANLKLEVFSASGCATPIHTQNFTTTNVNISLGVITVTIPAINLATVTGTVTNCANAPVTNGKIYLQLNNIYTAYNVNATGVFSFTRILCSGPEILQMYAEDITAQQQSAATTITINSGNNSLGNIQACGITTQQFFNFSINGTPHNFSAPVDSLSHAGGGTGGNAITLFGAFTTASQNEGSMQINSTGIALNSSQPLIRFTTNFINDTISIPTPINVTITEYGAIGQFISGNFTGAFRGGAPANTIYNVVCSFRIRRRF